MITISSKLEGSVAGQVTARARSRSEYERVLDARSLMSARSIMVDAEAKQVVWRYHGDALQSMLPDIHKLKKVLGIDDL